jgi:paraquat-inducible protein B
VSSKKARPALIGAFVLGALALGVVAIVVAGSGRFFRETHVFVLYFDGSVNGLLVGAPVKLRGVPIGAVSRILLRFDQADEDRRIPVLVELDEDAIRGVGGPVMDLEGRIEQMISRDGLRGRLETQSLLTGLLYVGFDFYPNAPDVRIRPPGSYPPEIPTVPTPLEQAQATLEDVLMKLREANLDKLVSDVAKTVEGLERLVNSEGLARAVDSLDEVSADLRRTLESVERLARTAGSEIQPVAAEMRQTAQQTRALLERAETTLLRTEGLLDPDSPLVYQLETTLAETRRSARALRELADSLESDPSSILFGRSPAAEPAR